MRPGSLAAPPVRNHKSRAEVGDAGSRGGGDEQQGQAAEQDAAKLMATMSEAPAWFLSLETQLGGQIGGLSSELGGLTSEFKALSSELKQRLGRVEEGLGRVETRLGRVETRLGDVFETAADAVKARTQVVIDDFGSLLDAAGLDNNDVNKLTIAMTLFEVGGRQHTLSQPQAAWPAACSAPFPAPLQPILPTDPIPPCPAPHRRGHWAASSGRWSGGRRSLWKLRRQV
jgi:hypothetical protein